MRRFFADRRARSAFTLAGMKVLPLPRVAAPRLAWPAPAVLVWLGAWGIYLLLDQLPATRSAALPAAMLAGLLPAWAWPGVAYWRRLIVAAGFPLSALGHGLAGDAGAGLPAWAWLLPAGLLLLAYPMRSWRDAPLYPTPADALQGLPPLVQLGQGARLLDAGCGLGHGLQALRQAFPDALLEGIEYSAPIAGIARWRCRFAKIRRGDMWRADWSGFDLVYLFQRPESMARAYAKARRELGLGCWLASLEFAVPGARATAVLQRPGEKPVWLYRIAEPRPLASSSTPARRSR